MRRYILHSFTTSLCISFWDQNFHCHWAKFASAGHPPTFSAAKCCATISTKQLQVWTAVSLKISCACCCHLGQSPLLMSDQNASRKGMGANCLHLCLLEEEDFSYYLGLCMELSQQPIYIQSNYWCYPSHSINKYFSLNNHRYWDTFLHLFCM